MYFLKDKMMFNFIESFIVFNKFSLNFFISKNRSQKKGTNFIEKKMKN